MRASSLELLAGSVARSLVGRASGEASPNAMACAASAARAAWKRAISLAAVAASGAAGANSSRWLHTLRSTHIRGNRVHGMQPGMPVSRCNLGSCLPPNVWERHMPFASRLWLQKGSGHWQSQ